MTAPKAIRFLKDGSPIEFEHRGHRILLKNLPAVPHDQTVGITVIEMEFDEAPQFMFASYYPQLQQGKDVAGDNKI